ncbi:hypothetical protein [Spirosoma montaniterrae]|uniref:Uncharacterized protein n=1 Tax=Spirosoma montaniterrae TaxID=1178516 RepID=A0A1P9X0A1_9BACT|nr:hypothetical protein [Spirosoma montaniterrae]AQG81042.1 hypothetical protein AWR27_17980 [Spirosoma montaniterrae]
MKKVVWMMAVALVCMGGTATMAQVQQDTTRRGTGVDRQTPRSDTSRTPQRTPGSTTKRDSTRKK